MRKKPLYEQTSIALPKIDASGNYVSVRSLILMILAQDSNPATFPVHRTRGARQNCTEAN
ncbi:MAG: hypothetical protein RL228_372 [Actinomycetota bacterium]|jgi:hypothetical protein